MAKKKNKALLVVGVAAAAVGVYLLTRKPSVAQTAIPTYLPPGSPTNTSSGSSTLSTILNTGLGVFKTIFGNSGTYAPLGPIGLAPTAGPVNSPAGGINYINPSAPDIFLPPASSNDTAGSGNSSDWNFDIFG